MQKVTEEQLLSMIKQSDHAAFDELHRRFWHPLYRLAFKKLGDKDETGDLLQEMFMEIWEKRETLHVPNGLENWLRNRVWFKLGTYFRHKKFTQRHYDDFASFLERMGETEVAPEGLELKENNLYYQELLNTINRCVEEMPNRMREIFSMYRRDGISIKEIAGTLNLSPKTVKVQLHRGISKLRKATEKHNPSPGELLFLLWLINY